jgi:hypothetical protein
MRNPDDLCQSRSDSDNYSASASPSWDCLSLCFCWAAELGRQLLLIHVDTPKRGKIQAWSANQNTRNPMTIRISIFEDPS